MSTATSTAVKAYAASSATSPLGMIHIQRRAPHPTDVQIEILYCGICHSDVHSVRNEWAAMAPTVYPIVPGHEIVGRVSSIGSSVTKYKIGDLVGVGCLVDSDGTCAMCTAHKENYCPQQILTFNGQDKHLGGVTYGGYSERIVVNERFVLRIPENLSLAGAAPLLCAGITTFSPLRRWGVKEGSKVGVVGVGGLGHMAVKLAHAMGAHVVVFTTTASKREDAIRLGAHEAIVSTVAEDMQKRAGSLDLILDTVSAEHDLHPYLSLLRPEGTMCLLGAPPKPLTVASFALLFGSKNLCGSIIGSLAETQEMLDFCGKHNITADVEVIPIQKVNEAYERLLKSDVKYRFCIDMASLKSQNDEA
jgi:uncharacterized zinc-type alcohol dehydrogenase-like protein